MDFKTTLEEGNVISTSGDKFTNYLKQQLESCESLGFSEFIVDIIQSNKDMFTERQLIQLRSTYQRRKAFYLTDSVATTKLAGSRKDVS